MTATALRDCLRRAGWSPRDLARAVNGQLERFGDGKHRIHPTAPYQWLRYGYRPYPPVPAVVAEVLSGRLGESVTVAMLWPDRADTGPAPTVAHASLNGSWALLDVVRGLDELAGAGAAERRAIRPATGVDLVSTALDGTEQAPSPLRSVAGGEPVLPPMMDLITEHIAALRRLDDRQGGGNLSLRYVTGELRTVLELIRAGSYRRDIGVRLYTAAADLAQLSGWMHFDAGALGAAQRYFLLGLRAARAAEDRTCALNILGMLAYQTAYARQPAEAIRLAEAADHLSGRTSMAMRARIAGRLATAHAAAGDIRAFRAAADRARTLLDRRPAGDDPPSLYYLSPDQLAAEAGQALVDLAVHNSGRARPLLAEAIDLLTPLTSAGPGEDYQRSALLHGCYLTQAHLLRGDLEAACAVTQAAVSRLAVVQSGRCRTLLSRVRRGLVLRKRNPWVADVLPELDRALWKP